MVKPSASTEVLAPDELPAPVGKLRPVLTEQSIKAIVYDLKMAERLVTEVLEEGIDFGQIPGVAGKGLWDPGASKIINAFECYPRHKILYHEETDDRITWAIECEIILRANGAVVGAGVGSCSTREPKYKYRWFTKGEATELGFTEPQIDAAKSKKGKRRSQEGNFYEVTEYRLENPEYGEQVNTILQMAAKRSETDASKTLPAVATALRRLFDADKKDRREKAGSKKTSAGKEQDAIDADSPRWTSFWNNQKNLLGDGYQEKTHKICGVTSMADWVKKGKTLDDATRLTAEHVKTQRRDPASVKEKDVPDGEAIEKIMLECFGWPPEKVWSEANYSSPRNFEEAGVETAWQVFLRLWNVYKDQHKT